MAALTVCLASCLGDSNDNNMVVVTFENVDFEKIKVPTSGVMPGVMIGQSYESTNGFVFQNYHQGDYNAGYTLSNKNDIETAGYENQYSVYSKSNIQGNQFLIYNPAMDEEGNSVNMYIQRKDGQSFYPYQMYVAPTTYTMKSIFEGANKFTAKDTLTVEIKGCDADGRVIKKNFFNLVQGLGLFQFDSYMGYGWMKFDYVKGTDNLWTPIPLYVLGKVNKILITFDSTDKGPFGINTPMYIAIDDFSVVAPESEKDFPTWLQQNNM